MHICINHNLYNKYINIIDIIVIALFFLLRCYQVTISTKCIFISFKHWKNLYSEGIKISEKWEIQFPKSKFLQAMNLWQKSERNSFIFKNSYTCKSVLTCELGQLEY